MPAAFRKQLPVYSPISIGGVLRAVRDGYSPAADPRHRLEARLKQTYGADVVRLFASGTHALTAAISRARFDDPQVPIALPAFTCYDVATAAVGAGGSILLYDIDPETLGPDWPSMERALGSGAGVVVVAPLYGVPVDWDRVSALAEAHGAAVVEDAAQGAGGLWRGRRIGSLGEFSVLSFGRGKGWTGGGGGALLARGQVAYDLAAEPPACLRNEALSAVTAFAQWLLGRPSLYGIPSALPLLRLGETHYREPGSLKGMGSFNAALALATFEAAEGATAARREAADRLVGALGSHPDLRFPRIPEDSTGGYLRLPSRIVDLDLRRRALNDLGRYGLGQSYPTPLHALAAVRIRLTHTPATPGAERLAEQLVTFPTHSRLKPGDLKALTQRLAPSSGRARAHAAAGGEARAPLS